VRRLLDHLAQVNVAGIRVLLISFLCSYNQHLLFSSDSNTLDTGME
jgi:hypothetical protein